MLAKPPKSTRLQKKICQLRNMALTLSQDLHQLLDKKYNEIYELSTESSLMADQLITNLYQIRKVYEALDHLRAVVVSRHCLRKPNPHKV